MEVAAIAGCCDESRADGEIGEPLAVLTAGRIGRKQRLERGDNAGMIDVLDIKFGQARAVECGAKIEVVAAGALPDQSDLGEIWPCAAVRATGHSDNNVFIRQLVRRQPLV